MPRNVPSKRSPSNPQVESSGADKPMPGDPGYKPEPGVIPSPMSSRKPGTPRDRMTYNPFSSGFGYLDQGGKNVYGKSKVSKT